MLMIIYENQELNIDCYSRTLHKRSICSMFTSHDSRFYSQYIFTVL